MARKKKIDEQQMFLEELSALLDKYRVSIDEEYDNCFCTSYLLHNCYSDVDVPCTIYLSMRDVNMAIKKINKRKGQHENTPDS